MENPKHFIELVTTLDPNKILLVEKFLNHMVDVDEVEIYNPKDYIHSEFSNKLYEEMKRLEADDCIANTRD